MLVAYQDTYAENETILPFVPATSNESDRDIAVEATETSVESLIISHPAWLNLQQLLHRYAGASQVHKSEFLPELNTALNSLFKLLYRLVDFNPLVQAISPNRFVGNPIETAEIISDGIMVLEALSVFGCHRSELVDRPGQSGLYISLENTVAINQYTKCTSAISEQCGINKLNRVLCTTLERGKALAFDPNQGNIVEIQTSAEKSIVLCIRYQYNLPLSKSRKGNTYFPITANQAQQSSLFARQVPRYS